MLYGLTLDVLFMAQVFTWMGGFGGECALAL